MKSVLKYLFLSACFLNLVACEDYLSELPTKGTNQPVTNLEQLEGLLNKPVYYETNFAASFSSDDYELSTTLYDATVSSNSFSMDLLSLRV